MELNALPTLVLMLQSEDPSMHGEAVCSYLALSSCNWFALFLLIYYGIFQIGAIGNLVHSSPDIKKEVIRAGALQPVISLLRYAYFSTSA